MRLPIGSPGYRRFRFRTSWPDKAGKDSKAQGGFGHSGQFALIDKEGNIRSRKDKFGNPILFYDGLEQTGIIALKEDIKLLLEE